MRRLNVAVILMSGCVLFWTSAAQAQFGRGGDWTTTGSDAQRSSWVRSDAKISPESLQKPGFQFLWKMKLATGAKQLNSLTEAMLMDRLIGYKGFRSLAFVGGSMDQVFVLDSDLARLEWKVQLPSGGGASTAECPGGLTSAVARPTSLGIQPPPAPGSGGSFGRGGPAKSDVGAPGAGAVTLSRTPPPRPNFTPPANTRAARRPARPAGGFGAPSAIYVLASNGMLHELNTQNGADVNPPIRFLPGSANASGLMMVEDLVYVATDGGCGGVADGIWVLDIGSKKVSNWKSGSGVAGSGGPAFGPDGTVYAATRGGEMVSLDGETLQAKGTYSAGLGFTSSAIVFDHKGKIMVAAATKDGRVHVVDAAGMTAVAKSDADAKVAGYAVGALASWQDGSGTRWILVPGSTAVVAWKLVDRGGSMALEQGWVSRELVSPLTPMVMNGVVFAVSSGASRDGKLTAAQRAQRSSPAVLYALDGHNGKELWNSGKTMTSFAHSGGLSGGGGQLYLSTYDGILYAFGFPMEH